MTKIYESDVEEMTIETLVSQWYTYLDTETQEVERPDLSEVVLKDRLKDAVDTLNPDIPSDAKDFAFKQILTLTSQDLVENNETFHKFLTEWVPVEYQKNWDTVWWIVNIVDYDNPSLNNFIVTNQFTITNNHVIKRPDIIILINGLPLVVIELKNPTDENATVKKAYTQLQNYKDAIPNLFNYKIYFIITNTI